MSNLNQMAVALRNKAAKAAIFGARAAGKMSYGYMMPKTPKTMDGMPRARTNNPFGPAPTASPYPGQTSVGVAALFAAQQRHMVSRVQPVPLVPYEYSLEPKSGLNTDLGVTLYNDTNMRVRVKLQF